MPADPHHPPPADFTRGPARFAAAAALLTASLFGATRGWTTHRAPAPDHSARNSIPAAGAPTSNLTATDAPAKLDLNRATAAELELLPRIGPALAKRIIDDRAARGPFRSINDLTRVRGIGDRTLDQLRPYLTARLADNTKPANPAPPPPLPSGPADGRGPR